MFVCVFTIQCWPKPSILCPGSGMIFMWSLRKMGWAALILPYTLILPPVMHIVVLLPVSAIFASMDGADLHCVSLVAGPAVCELLSVGICMLPVRTTLLQQVLWACLRVVCASHLLMSFMIGALNQCPLPFLVQVHHPQWTHLPLQDCNKGVLRESYGSSLCNIQHINMGCNHLCQWFSTSFCCCFATQKLELKNYFINTSFDINDKEIESQSDPEIDNVWSWSTFGHVCVLHESEQNLIN